MSTADEPPTGREGPENRPGRPTRSVKQTRALLIGVLVGGIVLVVAFMLLVSQCGTGNDGGIYGSGPGPAEAVAVSAV
jgi:hypothetical protein